MYPQYNRSTPSQSITSNNNRGRRGRVTSKNSIRDHNIDFKGEFNNSQGANFTLDCNQGAKISHSRKNSSKHENNQDLA